MVPLVLSLLALTFVNALQSDQPQGPSIQLGLNAQKLPQLKLAEESGAVVSSYSTKNSVLPDADSLSAACQSISKSDLTNTTSPALTKNKLATACTRECIAGFFSPFSPEEFSAQFFDLKAAKLSATGGQSSSSTSKNSRFSGLGTSADEIIEKYMPIFLEQGKLSTSIDIRSQGAKLTPFSATATPEDVGETIKQGNKSLVIRYEFINLPAGDPHECLAEAFSQEFGLPTTIHAYISGVSDQALEPHTDPYDTFILHLYGRKTWTVGFI